MQEGRTANTIRNLVYAWMSQGFTIVMNLVVRIIFVRILSRDYVGIAGLFTNIITVLSVAELGIGSAITYGLYAPLANGSQNKVKALMQFYRRVYIFIGGFILFAGIALTPFLAWFVKEMPDIPHIQVIYILFICNAAATYFFSYKGALISADQKDYILKKIRMQVQFLMYISQIFVLILCKNYIGYLSVQVIATVVMNAGFSRMADRMYPYLKDRQKVSLESSQLQQLIKNTKALFCHKIGTVIVFSTDNLIISKFTGLGNVANYTNYSMIQEMLNGVMIQLFSAMAPSVGNLVASENETQSIEVFWRVMFLNAWLYGGCALCFLCLAQDFIRLCFGEIYLISEDVLFIIILNFYLTGMRRSVLTFKDAFGIFYQNWYIPLLESGVNLIVSIFLVQKIGIIGVLLGTTISSIVGPLWSEPYVLFRYGFHHPLFEYWNQFWKYFFLTIGTGIIAWYLCNKITFIPIFSFLVKGICCVLIINSMFYIVLRKDQSIRYYLEVLRGLNVWDKLRRK